MSRESSGVSGCIVSLCSLSAFFLVVMAISEFVEGDWGGGLDAISNAAIIFGVGMVVYWIALVPRLITKILAKRRELRLGLVWHCECGEINARSNAKCVQCGEPRKVEKEDEDIDKPSVPWKCEYCGAETSQSNRCWNCKKPRPRVVKEIEDHIQETAHEQKASSYEDRDSPDPWKCEHCGAETSWSDICWNCKRPRKT
jgi:hypothetical protein